MVILIEVLWIYTASKFALFTAIDEDVPVSRPTWRMPIADFIYRAIRIAAAISVMYWMYWGLIWAVWLYVLAWAFKKICIFICYYDYL